MAVVLDTSALIEFERALAADTRPEMPEKEEILIPAIVWAEALVGARLADTPVRAAQRRGHLEAVRNTAEIVDFSPELAEHYADIFAELHAVGSLIPQNDIAVAATARGLGASVLVGPNDEAHFKRVTELDVRVVSSARAAAD